jgi:hypothetical protein
VFSPVNAETLVFSANENGRDDVAATGRFSLADILAENPLRQETYMKTANIAWWTLGKRLVSKMVKKIKPKPPMIAKAIAKPDRIFSVML